MPQHDDFDNSLDEDNWLLQTRGKYMKFVIYHSSNATEPRQTSNQKWVSFRKGIRKETTVYPTLKDERYFDGFSRCLYITAKSHECEEVLDPEYTATNTEKDVLEAKQVFMFSVFDKHSLTDMGKLLSENVCIQLMHSQFGRIFNTIQNPHPKVLQKRVD